MAPQFSYQLISKLFILFLLLQAFPINSENGFSQSIRFLKGARKGHSVKGLNQVKQYLKTFGYYPNHIDNLTDHYDDFLESALKTYQKYYRLQVTGKLDTGTMKKILTPRCGFPDILNHSNSDHHGVLGMVPNYYFLGWNYKWSKRQLTYTFSSSVQVMRVEEMRPVIARAFQRWATVAGFTFQEASTSQADIVIGFHRGYHGDDAPFDGLGNILAHGTLPESGTLHFDADEYWSASNPRPSYDQVDMESVAVHEIGHVLGLMHSQVPEAIMYPGYVLGSIKRDLRQDDIDGIRALYSG